jgi:hypothetical protein
MACFRRAGAQVLYDFGAGSTTATLLEYSSWKAKEMGKTKYHGQFKVKSVKWDATAGADALDLAICGVLRTRSFSPASPCPAPDALRVARCSQTQKSLNPPFVESLQQHNLGGETLTTLHRYLSPQSQRAFR